MSNFERFGLIKRSEWESGFPKVILNGSLGDANKHPQFNAAKAGDLEAAVKLVSDLITKSTVETLGNVIADKKPLLIPVHAKESVSINKIPLAYAVAIARKFKLEVELNIVQSARVNRSKADGFFRLALPPPFAGKPSSPADHAIIFDDTLTQGGTLASLINYVGGFGIKTIAATTLTGKSYSSTLAITIDTLNEIKEEYHALEQWWESYFGYGFSALTESEARHILRTKKTTEHIRDKIITERQTGIV